MSPRVYIRKFDWDEARILRGEGWTYVAIAERLGVSAMAVYLACNDEFRAKTNKRKMEWQKAGTCPKCGAPASRNVLQHRCRACFYKDLATSVREGELRCFGCREWKPDEDFPNNAGGRIARRGRHHLCRPCGSKARQDYRERNREKERAYERKYRIAHRARLRAERDS